jgi:serine/threonine protein kinase
VSEDLTGRRLGHYRIDGVLGKGGMSVMYRATDVRLGRKVALKVIAEHLTADPEFRERFVDEARNTSAIDHANVVPLYDFGEVDGLLYIAMRLVDGSDMASLISDGPLSPQRTLALLAQVAEALDNLHDRGLVHLDVKPANVLVTARESTQEHVYVADFGLTRRGATGHRTRGGDFLGSPTYAAPEHLRGEPVDGRTDAYSLACVIFACLTGRPPFTGQVPEVIQGHLHRDVPAITDQVVLPPGIDDVIRKGMAKTPGGRYGNCRELVAAARHALGAAAQSTVPPGRRPAGPRPPQPPVRHQQPTHQQPTHQQPGHQQPGHQQHQPPQHQHRPPAPSDPVRLRPPAAIGASAFREEKSGTRWVAPAVVGAVAIAIIVAVVLILTSQSDPGPGPGPATNPSIPVGPQGSGVTATSTTAPRPTLPTGATLPSIPIVPTTGD